MFLEALQSCGVRSFSGPVGGQISGSTSSSMVQCHTALAEGPALPCPAWLFPARQGVCVEVLTLMPAWLESSGSSQDCAICGVTRAFGFFCGKLCIGSEETSLLRDQTFEHKAVTESPRSERWGKRMETCMILSLDQQGAHGISVKGDHGQQGLGELQTLSLSISTSP